MALSVKILEKGAGTKTRTATASLGGLITSESTGYTVSNCTNTLFTATTHYWYCVGTAGTSMYMNYDTSVACATGKQVYFRAEMQTNTSNMDYLSMYVMGTTGGSKAVKLQASPVNGTRYTLSGVVTLDASCTGNVRLRWYLTDSVGVTGSTLFIFNWQAIDLTGQFGAGSEPTAAQLDAFYTWRCIGTYSNYGMYSSYGTGDAFYYASKVASHGLQYNDVVAIDQGITTDWAWSNVFPLNSDWIITNSFYEYDRGDASVNLEYWEKATWTSRVLAKSISMNLRNDIDGQVTLSFLGNSTWSPKLGMTVIFMDDSEYLFTGKITQIDVTELNVTNWKCDCVVSSLLTTLQWNTYPYGDDEFYGMTTMDAIDHLVFQHANWLYSADGGGQCFWRGKLDVGNASISVSDTHSKTLYELVNSLCTSAGMVLSIDGDRRLNARYQSITPSNAPRNITDAVSPKIFDVSYKEDINNYGNRVLVRGGYNAAGEPVFSGYGTGSAITDAIYAGNSSKRIIVSDSTVTNDTDGVAAAEYYFKRYGKVIPGEFAFTTTATDYRPDQKITVAYSSVGISATKTMHIDSVTVYDADGVNLLSRVVCSNRDTTDFAAAPNKGSTAYMTELSNNVSSSVAALYQKAGTFSNPPAFCGSSTAGTWAWTNQDGYYIRIGNMCFVSMRLVPSSITGSPTGDLKLTGLPFTTAAGLTQFLDVFSTGLNWGTSMTKVQLSLGVSSTNGYMYGTGNNIAWAAIPVANITAGDDIRISGWYQCI